MLIRIESSLERPITWVALGVLLAHVFDAGWLQYANSHILPWVELLHELDISDNIAEGLVEIVTAAIVSGLLTVRRSGITES